MCWLALSAWLACPGSEVRSRSGLLSAFTRLALLPASLWWVSLFAWWREVARLVVRVLLFCLSGLDPPVDNI